MKGGRKYLKHVLEIQNEHIQELKTVRETLRESFDDLECFLMPEPGKKITRGGTKVEQTMTIEEIDEEFLDCVKILVCHLFRETIVMKQVNGEHVTGNDLLNLTISYYNVFSSDDFPKLDSIYEASAKAAIRKTIKQTRNFYREVIASKLIGRFQEDNQLKKLHEETKNESLTFYDRQRKMGTSGFLAKRKKDLESDLESNFKLVQKKNTKSKAKADAFWRKHRKRLCEMYIQNMKNMWKPNDGVEEFAENCDKLCRASTQKHFSELLEDYPTFFIRQRQADLNSDLDKALKGITDIFGKKMKEATNIAEEAKLTAINVYERMMDKQFSLKSVEENEILEYHNSVQKKVLDNFAADESLVSQSCLETTKSKTASEIETLQHKYLENNRMNQQLEKEKIFQTVKAIVDYYSNLMKIEKEDCYICEEELEKKHESSKTIAIATFSKQSQDLYEKCNSKAEAEIESIFFNFKKLNSVRKSKMVRSFNVLAEVLLQTYKDNMEVKRQSNISEKDFYEAHQTEESRVLSQFNTKLPNHEPKKEFDNVQKQLEENINKVWNELQKDKETQDQDEVELAIETAIINCLSTIKELMEDRHIKEEALEKLFKIAKVKRDIEFKKLGISKESGKGFMYNQLFAKHYKEIYDKNKENKEKFLQTNYNPFEDESNSMCTIL